MKLTRAVMVVALTVAVALTGISSEVQASDKYRNFKQLKAHEKQNKDYRITAVDRPSKMAIIAIHGGSIESGTSELAKTIAANLKCDLYTFEGLKKKRNSILHITSTNFDEPNGVKLVSKSESTVSLHGCSGKSSITYMGGLDTKLGKNIAAHLKKAGFRVKEAPKRLAGKGTDNIANKNINNKGVQLEMTWGLRDSFFNGSDSTKTFTRYVEALTSALEEK